MADRVTAVETAKGLIGELWPADQAMVDTILARSVMPDIRGCLPYATGWAPAYDPYWLAAEAVQLAQLAAMRAGTITRWTSEGTTVESQPADLAGLAASLRSQSYIAKVSEGRLDTLSAEHPRGYAVPRSADDQTAGPRVIGNWS